MTASPLSLLTLLSSATAIAAYLPRLHVTQNMYNGRHIIADEHGREWPLHGINLATLGGGGSVVPIDTALYENGSCPPNNLSWYQPPICERDIAGVKALGYNSVRLLVHWSQIEPSPGEYDVRYLDRVEQIISWCGDHGLGVVVDFHQDNFADLSHFCCADDGAPHWAWLVNSTLPTLSVLQKLEIPLMEKIIPQLDWGGAEIAFHAFWHNLKVPATGLGLQRHYIAAVAELVNRTKHFDAVLAYELMNEPLPGLDIQIFGFASQFLYPFYARVIQALTGVRDGKPTCPCTVTGEKGVAGGLGLRCKDGASPVSNDCAYPDLRIHATDKLMVCEPMALRNQLDVSLQASRPFTEYANVLYAPHTYTRSFTIKKDIRWGFALDTAAYEARRIGAPILVTEWGGGSVEDLVAIGREQQRHLVNSMHWVWKQNGGGGWSIHTTSSDGQTFTVKPDRVRATSRIRPVAIAGALRAYRHDNESFVLHVRCASPLPAAAMSANNSLSRVTEIYFPSHYAACASRNASSSGGNGDDDNNSGGLYVNGTGGHLDSITKSAEDGSVVVRVSCVAAGQEFWVGSRACH